MKIHESFSYAGADVESVYALITDAAFRTEAAETDGASDVAVDVVDAGGGHTVTIERTQPAEMPDFVKKLTGETVQVRQTEQWGQPGDDGSRTADIKVSMVGQPAEMLGTAVLSETDSGSQFTLSGDVKVSIPIIGRKIEPEVARAITASVRSEVEQGTQRL